jgi:hypothetical protein
LCHTRFFPRSSFLRSGTNPALADLALTALLRKQQQSYPRRMVQKKKKKTVRKEVFAAGLFLWQHIFLLQTTILLQTPLKRYNN